MLFIINSITHVSLCKLHALIPNLDTPIDFLSINLL
jgi:hypothetical protein